jgi:hypothetical protein
MRLDAVAMAEISQSQLAAIRGVLEDQGWDRVPLLRRCGVRMSRLATPPSGSKDAVIGRCSAAAAYRTQPQWIRGSDLTCRSTRA